LPELRQRSPIRVVMDGDLRTPMLSQLVKTAREFPTWLIGNANASVEREWALRSAGVEVLRVKEGTAPGRLDLQDALGLLADWGITRLMVEGGPTLVASLLEADMVDEFTLLTGHWALGEPGTPALSAAHVELLESAHAFRLAEQRSISEDTLQLFERQA
jgi:diaminohydroxyphosphoribosylaminopyrimidine deaminase / 5-amino-6-(5-phosphoribosylamino)uracil reductase